MKSFKKAVINLFIFRKTALIAFVVGALSVHLTQCQSTPRTTTDIPEALELQAQSIKGSISEYYYSTETQVVVRDQGKKTKKYKEFAKFDIARRTLHVNEKGEMQFQIVTSNKQGNMNLKDLAYPEPGEQLFEMVDKFGTPLVVKDYPIGSIFYIPRVALPKAKIKAGDEWTYKGRWISEETGWPFEIHIKSKLDNWSDCDGGLCAVISFNAQVVLPEDFPLKGNLKSTITGQYHYSPFSFDVLWGESKSEEIFNIKEISKIIEVESKSCSYKKGYFKKCAL